MAITASFTSDVTEGSLPLVVNFTDTSTGSPAHDKWWWDFGDNKGNSQNESQNPTHTYTEVGTYTVTLTVWREEDSNFIYSTVIGAQHKIVSSSTEATAWATFLVTDLGATGNNPYAFGYDRSDSGVHKYTARTSTFRIDLSSVSSDSHLILKYRSRVGRTTIENCNLDSPDGMTITNDLGLPDRFIDFLDISDSFRRIALIDSYAGGNFDIELSDVNDYTQRIGLSCENSGGSPGYSRGIEIIGANGVRVTESQFLSWNNDSETKANFIIANDPLITRPPLLFSGNKEVSFSDGWENKKHFLVKQTDPYPCTIQAIDLYVETSDGD